MVAKANAKTFIEPRDPSAIQASRNKRPKYTFNVVRLLQLNRRDEMIAIYRDRLQRKVPVGQEKRWARIIADVAAFLYSTIEREFETVRGQIGIQIDPRISDQAIFEVAKMVADKGHAYKPISADRAGDDLEVLLDEVTRLNLKRFWAVDETREDREERIKAERREADKRRKRVKRGGKPRQLYEGLSIEKAKPWLEEGISRRTWYRRRKAGTGMSARIFFESGTDRVVPQGFAEESITSSPTRIKRASG